MININDLTAAVNSLAKAIESNSYYKREIVDIDGVAEILTVSERTVRQLDASGKIPRAIKIGSSKRWSISELNSWIAAGAPGRLKWENIKEQGA